MICIINVLPTVAVVSDMTACFRCSVKGLKEFSLKWGSRGSHSWGGSLIWWDTLSRCSAENTQCFPIPSLLQSMHEETSSLGEWREGSPGPVGGTEEGSRGRLCWGWPWEMSRTSSGKEQRKDHLRQEDPWSKQQRPEIAVYLYLRDHGAATHRTTYAILNNQHSFAK